MQRVTRSTAVEVLPARPEVEAEPGFFSPGDKALGVPPTVVGYEWFNMIQEELVNIVLSLGGGPLNKEENDQAAKAILTVFDSVSSVPSYDNAHEFSVDPVSDTLNVGGQEFFSLNDRVYLASSGTLPGGLSVGVYYYVVGITTTTLQLSDALGGSVVNIVDVGTGTHSIHRCSEYPLLLAKEMGRVDGKPTELLGQTAAKGLLIWDGTNSIIRKSLGVSSVTDGGTGVFTTNWATAFSSSHYSVQSKVSTYDGASFVNVQGMVSMPLQETDITAGGALLYTKSAYSSSHFDAPYNAVIAHGDQA